MMHLDPRDLIPFRGEEATMEHIQRVDVVVAADLRHLNPNFHTVEEDAIPVLRRIELQIVPDSAVRTGEDESTTSGDVNSDETIVHLSFPGL